MHIEPISSPYKADPKITSPASGLAEKIGDTTVAATFPKAILRWRNDRWASAVGLDGLDNESWLHHFAAFAPLPDNLPQPLALRYNPQIGDGRGFLFAQIRDGHGRLLDLGTKGSGQTLYSRDGDGRLTLKGAVRELLATEMLEALGVHTSKTFSIVETGEELWRGDEPSPTRSAVLTRLSHSHIRFGSFQRIAFEQDEQMLQSLITYCLRELYDTEPEANPAAQLLDLVVPRVADLAASYMVAGFVHGVLNTDNMNITGESFDYGPWRFTPNWQPGFTAAYFDHNGLYAFGRQAEAMHWNLGQLAVALRLVSEADPLIAALEKFSAHYRTAMIRRFLWRLGVPSANEDADGQLVEAAERAMMAEKIAIDVFFLRHRSGAAWDGPCESDEYRRFNALLSEYLPTEGASDKKDQKPCSLHIDEVEKIWSHIAEGDDWGPLQAKVAQIQQFSKFLRR